MPSDGGKSWSAIPADQFAETPEMIYEKVSLIACTALVWMSRLQTLLINYCIPLNFELWKEVELCILVD